jgi:hypothetical protein
MIGSMPTSPKRKAASPAVAPEKPFLRFYHSEALRHKTLAVLVLLEESEDPTDHVGELADMVIELMNSGMDYFFMQPLKESKAGFIVQQSANLGLAGAQQVIGSVIRKIIQRMDDAQLISVCGSIRRLMV